jgi:two-component system chemotaxis response regulator CheB
MRPFRVLIVDDDPIYRVLLARTLEAMPEVLSVSSAANLAIARSKLERGDLDVVTLDVLMNNETGLELLPWIHARFPELFTILLTSGGHRDASQVIDALLLGACTLIIKPGGTQATRELTEAMRTALASVPDKAPARSLPTPPGAELRVPKHEAVYRELIAIGASTGGPAVVLQFLCDLPKSFEVPILLTQHMPALHVPYFVDNLARQSGRRVVIGQHGATIERGCVYVAGDGKHLLVTRQDGALVLAQSDGPEEHNCRPAVDPMFVSVARVCGAASVGVVMTGMGADGGQGALALRGRGAPVVVQDQATSVVWGMPGAVASAGAATVIAPAKDLAKWVVRWTSAI